MNDPLFQMAAHQHAVDMDDMDDASQADDRDAAAATEPQPSTSGPLPGEVARRERYPSTQPTPLAFVLSEGGPAAERKSPVTNVRWSASAFAQLQALQTQFREQKPRVSIPVASLRAHLELADELTLRLDRDVGLRSGRTYSALLWTQTDPARSREDLHDAALRWLVNDVSRLAETDEARHCVERLKQLTRERQLLELDRRIATPYRWGVTQSRTAKALSAESYADLADDVARRLEGRPVFPGLSGLRRIVSEDLQTNQAELMTEPITIGARTRFSLVVRVRVLSYPGRSAPVIAVEFTRRVWASALRDRGGRGEISGYAFPDGSTRALRFTLRRARGDDGIWRYEPNDDFLPIARRYITGLPPNVETMLTEGHQLLGCKLLIGQRHGVAARAQVKGGVPDLDKLEAFERIAAVLSSHGLRPWDGVHQVKTLARPTTDRNQHWPTSEHADERDQRKRAAWLLEAQESIRACYGGMHDLVIAVQPDPQVEADAREAERRLSEILQGSVTVTRIPISSQVHGPRAQLPGRELDTTRRADLRMQAWEPVIDTVRQHEARTGRKVDGVLVLARQWYENQQHDDIVNKRAGRIALARGLGVAVQYLRPREDEDRGHIDRHARDEDFERRLMAAWLDLAYSSIGRVRPAMLRFSSDESTSRRRAEAEKAFGRLPDRILALSVVRRNTSHFLRNDRSFLPCAIELDMESGVCTASFAYEDHATRALSVWEPLPLPQALVALAGLGPVQLSSARQDRKRALEERTQAFFKERLADISRRSTHPLVLVDADTCRYVWPWLTDERLDPENVQLAGGFNAQVAWSNAQLVRIRTKNSPKVLWDNVYRSRTLDTDEPVEYRAPRWAEAQLFKLSDTVGTNVYLSFGSFIRTNRRRGVSSYREVAGMRPIGRTGRYQAVPLKPFTDAWSTPIGVEICVVYAGGEEADRTARLVEWLRKCYAHVGDWTTQPAPLFFAHVLKDYLADFQLDEEEASDADEEFEDN